MTESLSCQELVELITEYLEDSLPAAERARFDHHLNQCSGCQHYLDQIRQTIALAGKLREADLPAQTQTELLDLFRDWKAGRKD